jgi:hypothetical protein
MNGIEELTMAQEEATEQLNALKQLFKENRLTKDNKIYMDLKRVYGHMTHGGKIIDIYKAFKQTGLEKGNPKIAICTANAKKCYLTKETDGSAVFSAKFERWGTRTPRKYLKEIQVPAGTFNWIDKHGRTPRYRSDIKDQQVNTIAPIIPPHILIEKVKYNLKNYHILWEVEAWKPEPPRDPILLKQITPNLFGILATWDLTEIERAIIKAHIT